LREEIEAIWRANKMFWRHAAESNLEQRYDYSVRIARLEEIRAELAQAAVTANCLQIRGRGKGRRPPTA